MIEMSKIFPKTAPNAIKEIKDLKPLHGLPTTKFPAGIVMLKPSLKIGMPKKLIILTPIFATIIFNGKEITDMKAIGRGNINKRKSIENKISFVNAFPKR